MELQALGYFGIRASNLDDWAAFATRLVGFELVEKSKSSLTFRMDDRRQRVVVEADHDDGAAFFGWEVADGATPEEAMREAADAARSWIRTAKAHGDPIPTPSRVDRTSYSGRWVLRTPKTLHKRLSERAKAEGVSLNTLAVTLLAEGLGDRSANEQ